MVDPRSALSEAYRTLRTSIQFSGVDGAPRSLLVTSTEPGEGKSSVVRKLAEEFAALGHHVLIVDADMRRPVLHRFARVENSMGLSNLLTNNVPVERAHEHIDIMSGTPWPNVWMVSAGTLPPNPANLLASKKMGLFIEACTQRFDIVIIDSPPVIGLADALLLSRMSEATLLVVSAHQVARKAAHNAHKRLRSAGAHVIGAALNKFRIDRVEYNYAYRYMNYGYLTYGAHGDRPYQAGDGTANGSSRRLIKGRKRPSLGRFGWGKRTGSSQRRRGADRNHASSMGPQA